jgi:hypothetical protein
MADPPVISSTGKENGRRGGRPKGGAEWGIGVGLTGGVCRLRRQTYWYLMTLR